MAHPLEADFREWSKPPTATEDQRCGNAESVVRNAIRSYPAFATRNVEIFAQGSYRNGTDVRTDSDVDVCVRCTDVCFLEMPSGYTKSERRRSKSLPRRVPTARTGESLPNPRYARNMLQ